jgi:Carbohydrate binding module (family 6)
MGKFFLMFGLVLFLTCSYAQTGTSTWIGVDGMGTITYTPDVNGNKLPDFSGVGFENSEKTIPYVPVVMQLSPLPAADNSTQIEAAIAQIVANYPRDPITGFRGALLLKAGEWQIDNTVDIVNSGILIRGEGSHDEGTIIVADELKQYTVFYFKGWNSPTTTGTSYAVQGTYIPVGEKVLTLSSAAHGFQVGDKVHLRVTPNSNWVDLIGMNVAGGLGTPSDPIWYATDYIYSYHRVVKAVSGATITLDAPVVDMIDANYKTASVIKESWAGDVYVGIEHLRIVGRADAVLVTGGMAWEGIVMEKLENGFVNDVEVYYTNVHTYITSDARYVTIKNCRHYYPKSIILGGYRYGYWIKRGQRVLVLNTFSFEDRHTYITGKNTLGPNVFVNGYSGLAQADDGPHENWATGILLDRIKSTSTIKVQNRKDFGTSHGWVSSACLLWNCEAPYIVNQSPPGHINWAIGCSNVTGNGDKVNPYSDQVNESEGNQMGFGLFEKQLSERLGSAHAEMIMGQEPFLFNAPFQVPQKIEAEHYDLGGEGVSFHDTEYKNIAGSYRFDGGPDLKTSNDSTVLTDILPNEWVEYTISVSQGNTYPIRLRYYGENSGTINLYLDEVFLGSVSINSTNSYEDYIVTGNYFNPGKHVLKLDFNLTGGKLDYLSVDPAAVTTSVEVSEEAKYITASPNPFFNHLRLSSACAWKITNSQGVLMLEGNSSQIDTSPLSPGMFILLFEGQKMMLSKVD